MEHTKHKQASIIIRKYFHNSESNQEAMSGDIYFDSNYKRTISNDIRYILFMIDKFGGATNLINEMKIVK